jgi:flagellar protein FlaG
MVKVLDKDTGKVVREIPPEKILDMVAKFMEKAGIIVDERR